MITLPAVVEIKLLVVVVEVVEVLLASVAAGIVRVNGTVVVIFTVSGTVAFAFMA